RRAPYARTRRSLPTRRSSDRHRHGDADVEVLLDEDAGALDGAVQPRVRAERLDGGQHEVRRARELDALALLERVLVPLAVADDRSEEHTSELQSRENLVCRRL